MIEKDNPTAEVLNRLAPHINAPVIYEVAHTDEHSFKPSRWVRGSSIVPREAGFLTDGIPSDNITIFAAAGGSGKDFLSAHLICAVTNGKGCIFDKKITERQPARALYVNAEDSYSVRISKRLMDLGVNQDNLITWAEDEEVAPGSSEVPDMQDICEAIEVYRPQLTIISPLQSFVPVGAAMERRNVMRKIMQPIQKTAAKFNCAVIIVMHTNKRIGAYGRNKLADSSDLWDIARSVFIIDETFDGNGTMYISHEKNSYGEKNKTQLFKIGDLGDGRIGLYWTGETSKSDRDFVLERDKHPGGRPPVDREAAEDLIIDELKKAGGSMDGKQLAMLAGQNDIKEKTFRNAKASLKKSGLIDMERSGRGADHKTMYRLIEI